MPFPRRPLSSPAAASFMAPVPAGVPALSPGAVAVPGVETEAALLARHEALRARRARADVLQEQAQQTLAACEREAQALGYVSLAALEAALPDLLRAEAEEQQRFAAALDAEEAALDAFEQAVADAGAP